MPQTNPVLRALACRPPSKIAAALGVSRQVVSNWRARLTVPANYVQALSILSGVPPHELRPDVFPRPTTIKRRSNGQVRQKIDRK